MQSTHLRKQQREEGRPDPEELLARYSLRDSDLEATISLGHLHPGERAGSTRYRSGALSAQARTPAYLPGRGGRRWENLCHAQRGTSS